MKTAMELYVNNPKSKEIINRLKKDYKKKSIEQLKDILKIIGRQSPNLSIFRYRLLVISMTLSDKGIAPRWQGLFDACETKEQHKSRNHDGIVMDLYWLYREFPKQKTIIARWQPIFTGNFDLELAASISGRQKKVSYRISNLSLSVFQQLGCIILSGNEAKLLRDKSYRAREGRKERKKQTTYANKLSNDELLLHHADIVYCAKLAYCKPTKTAQVYRWTTGHKRTRQVMAQNIKRLSIKPFSK